MTTNWMASLQSFPDSAAVPWTTTLAANHRYPAEEARTRARARVLRQSRRRGEGLRQIASRVRDDHRREHRSTDGVTSGRDGHACLPQTGSSKKPRTHDGTRYAVGASERRTARPRRTHWMAVWAVSPRTGR